MHYSVAHFHLCDFNGLPGNEKQQLLKAVNYIWQFTVTYPFKSVVVYHNKRDTRTCKEIKETDI